MLSTRPKIAELVFRLYGRNVHPELFEVCGSKQVERGDYQATVAITNAGHFVVWRHRAEEKLSLTEVAASAHDPLPEKHRLLSQTIVGERHAQADCRARVGYEVTFSLDTLPPAAFHAFQAELALTRPESGILHRFESNGRLGLGALSYVNVQSRDRSLVVRALHTFPDDLAIVRTHSVFRTPDPSR